jgi:hypothetical protein
MLVGEEIAQLHMGFRKRIIERDGLFEQRFTFLRSRIGVSTTLALPQTHGVVVLGQRIVGPQLSVAPESADHIVRVIGRTVVGPGEKECSSEGRRGPNRPPLEVP